jgi:UrcA family protein
MSKDPIMTVIHALLAFATLTVPTVATAASGSQSVAIDVGDLNLASDKGQRILALRIQRAARAICKTHAMETMPQNIRNERKCIREAQSSAESAVLTLNASGDPARGPGG